MSRSLHFLKLTNSTGRILNKAMPTYTICGKIVLHFGTKPLDVFGRDNPFDMSAFIPASEEPTGGLKLIIITAAAIADTTIDILAGTFYTTVYEVLGASISDKRLSRAVENKYSRHGYM